MAWGTGLTGSGLLGGNMGITNIKLGRTFVRERKYVEAEGHILNGYRIQAGQPLDKASSECSCGPGYDL